MNENDNKKLTEEEYLDNFHESIRLRRLREGLRSEVIILADPTTPIAAHIANQLSSRGWLADENERFAKKCKEDEYSLFMGSLGKEDKEIIGDDRHIKDTLDASAISDTSATSANNTKDNG